MLRQAGKPLALVVSSAFLMTVGILGALGAQKASVPRPQDKLAMGQGEVRQLLLLMDTDKNGKVSKEHYMRFMEAEFDRLDKARTGELDVRELTKSTETASRFAGK